MQANVENLGALERSIDISVSPEEFKGEVTTRLKRIAKTAKMHGFRPGKIPMKMIEQQYGPQAEQEVLNEAVNKRFNDAIKALDLKVAGYPRFEVKDTEDTEDDAQQFEFTAKFEVYPEVNVGDLSGRSVEKLTTEVKPENIDSTLDIIRKQRTTYETVERAAAAGDRVNINYHGRVDGQEFDGNKADNVSVMLGEGRFLKDFEDALIGVQAGESKSFDVNFPEDYHGKEVAGKKATFEAQLNKVEAAILPEVNEAFAKELGIEDGNVDKMREEIAADLEREVAKRVQSKLKEEVMQVLLDAAEIDAPKILINQELERLMQNTRESLQARGMKKDEMPLSTEMFQSKAEYRVKLGLILSDLVKAHELKAQPDQVRKVIEHAAQGYENPAEVVKWHYASPERLQEAESLALEDNVVAWVLEKVKITDKNITFDELMRMS